MENLFVFYYKSCVLFKFVLKKFFFLYSNLFKWLLLIQTPVYLFMSNLQDPAEADKLMKIQKELDETKIILVSIKLNMHYFIFAKQYGFPAYFSF